MEIGKRLNNKSGIWAYTISFDDEIQITNIDEGLGGYDTRRVINSKTN
jgi:hypothetical protein